MQLNTLLLDLRHREIYGIAFLRDKLAWLGKSPQVVCCC